MLSPCALWGVGRNGAENLGQPATRGFRTSGTDDTLGTVERKGRFELKRKILPIPARSPYRQLPTTLQTFPRRQ